MRFCLLGFLAALHFGAMQGAVADNLFPEEQNLHRYTLTSGVECFVQQSENRPHQGSLRVVFKTTPFEQKLFSYDGEMDLSEIDQFLSYCEEKVKHCEATRCSKVCGHDRYGTPYLNAYKPHQIAVVAVGDFDKAQVEELIHAHFSSIKLTSDPCVSSGDSRIQIDEDSQLRQVALHVDFRQPLQAPQTYEDLSVLWKQLLLRDLYEYRMESATRLLDETWIHPHLRFLYPVSGYAMATEELSENALSFLLWQIELIRLNGFEEDEFYAIKNRLLSQIYYLESQAAFPDCSLLASFYIDQFTLGGICYSFEDFLNASEKYISEISFAELPQYIAEALAEENCNIRVVYPSSPTVPLLTQDKIQEILERVAELATLYQQYADAEDLLMLLSQESNTAPHLLGKPSQAQEERHVKRTDERSATISYVSDTSSDLPIRLANAGGPTPATTALSVFYQLPLSDKESRIITQIIRTMADKNVFELLFEKKDLERKGKRINHVHPLRFMGHILADSKLRRCLKEIRGSSFKWDHLIDGFAKKMRDEAAKDNLASYLPGFAELLSADLSAIQSYIYRKDYEGLVKYLM